MRVGTWTRAPAGALAMGVVGVCSAAAQEASVFLWWKLWGSCPVVCWGVRGFLSATGRGCTPPVRAAQCPVNLSLSSTWRFTAAFRAVQRALCAQSRSKCRLEWEPVGCGLEVLW